MNLLEVESPIPKALTRPNKALWAQVQQYGPTFATELTVLICQILTYKLAAHFLGKEGFSAYAIARRAVSLIYPLPLLGMAIAVPRYIAHSHGLEKSLSDRYFGAAIVCVGCALALTLLCINFSPRTFAYVFFGNAIFSNLAFPMSLVLVGLVLHSMLYSYFRGILAMKFANLLQLCNLGLLPLLAFTLFGVNLTRVLFALGGLTTLAAIIALLFTPFRTAATDIRPESYQLLKYGIQRVPGDFIYMALLGLPVTALTHLGNLQQAGFLAFSISLLGVIGSMFTPIGLVLLPKAGKLMAKGAMQELKDHTWLLAKLTFGTSAIIGLGIAVFARPLFSLYLGPGYGEAAVFVRPVLLGAIPFSLYILLRNIVDAFHERGITTIILAVGLITFGVALTPCLWIHNKASVIVPAFMLAILALGILTSVETRRIFRASSNI